MHILTTTTPVESSFGKEGVMLHSHTPLPYSPKALRALQHSLEMYHDLMVWHNPTTNQIAIKRITQSQQDSLGVTTSR